MDAETSHDDLIAQFVDLTGATPEYSEECLTISGWNLSSAAAEYFTQHGLEDFGEPRNKAPGGEDDPQETETYTGPRTLDGRPAPQPIPSVGSSSRVLPPKKRGGFATLGSLGQSSAGGGHGHGHGHDDDDDDDDDDDYEPGEEPRDLFAGGEKSGLAVQDPSNRNDPRNVVNDILKKARENARHPAGEGEPSSAPPSRFRGSGQTLGGDDAPSRTVADPHPSSTSTSAPQTRVLHLWEDGFSVEDGPLRRFDDPQNANDLQTIRSGRAPLHLMGIQPDQPVDVQLIKHDSAYKAPPKVYKPFSGQGQRLGSPAAGVSSSASGSPSIAPPSSVSTSIQTSRPELEVDSSQPTVSLRIQLANGARLPARFNTSHTIADVYDFIERAYPDSNARPWVLATTFPNKDHTDKSLILGEVPEFSRGGTAVQKWA